MRPIQHTAHGTAAHAVCRPRGSPAARPAFPAAPLPRQEHRGRDCPADPPTGRWACPPAEEPWCGPAAGGGPRPPRPVPSGARRAPRQGPAPLSPAQDPLPPPAAYPSPSPPGAIFPAPPPRCRGDARPPGAAGRGCPRRLPAASGRRWRGSLGPCLPRRPVSGRRKEAPWPRPGLASRRRSCGACGASAQVRTATGLWRGPGLGTGPAAAPAPVGGGAAGPGAARRSLRALGTPSAPAAAPASLRPLSLPAPSAPCVRTSVHPLSSSDPSPYQTRQLLQEAPRFPQPVPRPLPSRPHLSLLPSVSHPAHLSLHPQLLCHISRLSGPLFCSHICLSASPVVFPASSLPICHHVLAHSSLYKPPVFPPGCPAPFFSPRSLSL